MLLICDDVVPVAPGAVDELLPNVDEYAICQVDDTWVALLLPLNPEPDMVGVNKLPGDASTGLVIDGLSICGLTLVYVSV